MTPQLIIQPWYSDVPRNPRLAKVAGMAIMLSTIMGFGVWVIPRRSQAP